MILSIFCGLLAGIFGGLVGVGGGTIMIPFMAIFMGMSQHAAQGTSLAVMLPPVGLFAVWTYYKQGYVNIPMALLMMAGFLLGAWIGAKFAVALPAFWIKKIFGGFLVGLGVKYLFF